MKVKTGDLVLCLSNTATAQIIRILNKEEYNHIGIAILFDERGKISLTDRGRLCILEINTWERKDAITGKKCIGAAYSDFEWFKKRYNLLAVRRLHDRYRIPALARRITKFVEKYRGYEFTTNFSDIFSMATGLPLDGTTKKSKQMLCSELTAHFLIECVGSLFPRVDKTGFHGSINELLGDEGPHFPSLTMPGHYSYYATPNAKIFHSGPEKVIYVKEAGMGAVLISIVIIVLTLAVLLAYAFSNVIEIDAIRTGQDENEIEKCKIVPNFNLNGLQIPTSGVYSLSE